MKYYAHSKENEPMENWQLLEKHLKNVSELTALFAKKFNAENWGRIAGYFHDIGKTSNEFQAYLRFVNNIEDKSTQYYKGKVDHATAGAQLLCDKFGEQIGKLLAYSVAGHHSGLPNGKDETNSSLYARLKKDIYKIYEENNLISAHPNHDNLPFSNNLSGFNIAFFIRMLYSCLVDADFMDTESFMDFELSNERNKKYSLKSLILKLDNHISSFNPKSSFINERRFDILEDCRQASNSNHGFFSLTVPTGGGKTISSLAFALNHAIKNGMDRIIYVIPYTSIIEQNAQVFRDILGDDSVIEHHSNFDPEKETRFSKLATQNWDAPVIVTTNVQFFESLFSNKSSKCRKLHNIANSVVILDEAQMLPLNLLTPCLTAMKALVEGYNTSIVLCTATQPALVKTNDFKSGLPEVKEIITDPQKLYEDFNRVSVSYISEPLADDDLCSEISAKHQVLCIVSNKRQAREIYNNIENENGVFHLSSMMCPEHRTKKLAKIKANLAKNKTCKVISTQLIEAGVDIDFPFVFRAIAGIDSIAQAAGRCNREGKLKTGIVKVFRPSNPQNIPPGFLRQTSQIGEQVLNHHINDILSLEATEEYFKRLFWQNESQLDAHGICDSINRDIGKLNFPFKDVAQQFSIINNKTHSIIIPYGDKGEKICLNIRNSYEFINKKILQQAQRFTVQIHPIVFNALRASGVLESFLDEKFWILNNLDIYHEELGLIPDDPYFYKVDTLMI